MSVNQLKSDLARNIRSLSGTADVTAHLRDTLWPWLESLLDEIGEIDEAVGELVDQAEDFLQPDTAAIFANVIQACAALAGELRKRAPGDQALAMSLAQADQIVQAAAAKLAEITGLSDGDEDDEDDEDEDEDEDDNEEESGNA
jgi:ABC-type transporter Mla subunit MlaD